MEKIDFPSLGLNAVFFSYSTVTPINQAVIRDIKKALGGQKARRGDGEWQACRNYTSSSGQQHYVSLYLAEYPPEQGNYYIEVAYTLGGSTRDIRKTAKFSDALNEVAKITESLLFIVRAEFHYNASEPMVMPLPNPIGTEDFTEVRGMALVKLLDDNKSLAYSLEVSLLPEWRVRCLVTFGLKSTFSDLSVEKLIRQAHTLSRKFFKQKD